MKKNILLNITYQIIIIAIPLITMPYISRVLSADGVGLYTYSYTIVNYFCLFSMLGINNYGNREIARAKTESEKATIFWELILFRSIVTICMLMFYFSMSNIYRYSFKITLAQSILLFGAFIDLNWLYYGLEKLKPLIIKNLFFKVITTILIFILIKSSDDFIIYVCIMSLGQVLGQLFLWPSIIKRFGFVKIRFSNLKKHIRPMVVLFIPILGLSAYRLIDKTMIGMLLGDTECGYYESADKIVNILLTVLASVGTVLMPRMSYLVEINETEKVNKILSKVFIFVIVLSLGMVFGTIAISNQFVPVFFGDEYKPTINILNVLALSVFFSSITNIIRTGILIPNKMDLQYLIAIIIGAVINVVLNVSFILIFNDTLYVAISTLISEIIVFLIQIILVRKYMVFKSFFVSLLLALVSGIIMYFSLKFISGFIGDLNIYLQLFLKILFGIIVYSVAILFILFLMFRKKTILVLKMVLKK